MFVSLPNRVCVEKKNAPVLYQAKPEKRKRVEILSINILYQCIM